jgi:C-terminal processing protease CtpA/Prc
MQDSPAADAGVQVGDRIRAIDGVPTSRLHTAQELLSRACGAPDTHVELELERAGAVQFIRVRIRRVALPDHNAPIKILPDGSGFQA